MGGSAKREQRWFCEWHFFIKEVDSNADNTNFLQDILPLLLAPGPTVPLHAQTSISTIHPYSSDLPPHAQLRALLCAVRWEASIAPSDFLGPVLEGERWLVWAANNVRDIIVSHCKFGYDYNSLNSFKAEEASAALLLAHAALLSTKKRAWRRAALWYVLAATRLEKCGIVRLSSIFVHVGASDAHSSLNRNL